LRLKVGAKVWFWQLYAYVVGAYMVLGHNLGENVANGDGHRLSE
jgi:hypothetical protein